MVTSEPKSTPWASVCNFIPFNACFSPEFKETAGFETDHWQLNDLEAITGYPLDYRVTKTLVDKVGTV